MNKLFNIRIGNFPAFYNIGLHLIDQENPQQLQCPGCREKYKGKPHILLSIS